MNHHIRILSFLLCRFCFCFFSCCFGCVVIYFSRRKSCTSYRYPKCYFLFLFVFFPNSLSLSLLRDMNGTRAHRSLFVVWHFNFQGSRRNRNGYYCAIACIKTPQTARQQKRNDFFATKCIATAPTTTTRTATAWSVIAYYKCVLFCLEGEVEWRSAFAWVCVCVCVCLEFVCWMLPWQRECKPIISIIIILVSYFDFCLVLFFVSFYLFSKDVCLVCCFAIFIFMSINFIIAHGSNKQTRGRTILPNKKHNLN